MYKTLFGILAVFAVAFLVVGLTFSASREERADYVFINGTEPKSLDPHKMTGVPEGRIADAIFEGLTFDDVETLRPSAGSAESWESTPDGKRWTFRMRPTAKWSNGDPVTARDFVYAWKRFLDPKTASEYAYLIHFVKHAQAFNTFGGHVEALVGDPAAEKPEAREGAIKGFDGLRASNPRGIDAGALQKFFGARKVRDAVTGTKDSVILDAFERTKGTVSADEAKALSDAFAGEAKSRAAALALAHAHLGVDEGFFAPDDRTFVVELNQFTPYFLELTSFYPLFPVHRPTVERWPNSWFVLPERIVSNGPFLLDSWRVNDRIRLRKNPGYWDADAVSLQTVEALSIENSTTQLNLFLKGDVDWGPSAYPVDLIDTLKTRPDFYRGPATVVYYYRFNVTKKPLDDPRVRLALSLAFDRQLLVDKVTRGGQLPATTFVPPGIPGYRSPTSKLGFDVARAKALLAEAGFPDGRGFPKQAILHNTHEGHRKYAEWIADQWRRNLGIDVNAVNQEWQSYQESTRRLDYQIARAAWVADYIDPNTFLDMWITKGGNNQTGWGDPTYDRLIALAADPLSLASAPAAARDALVSRLKEKDEAKRLLADLDAATDDESRTERALALRLQLFREAEAILVQDAFPVMPIYFYVNTGLVKPYVERFYRQIRDTDGSWIPNLQDLHPFRDVRISRDSGAR